MTDAARTQDSNITDHEFRRMTLTEHFSYLQKLKSNARKPAVITQESADAKTSTVVRIHWDDFSGQHPAVKDVLPGQTVDPLIARIQAGIQGRKPKYVYNSAILFQWMPSIFGLASSAGPTGDEAVPGFLTTVEDVLATAFGITMSRPSKPSPISPDYGIGYFLAYDRTLLPNGPVAATDLAYTCTYAVRTWFAPTVRLTAGDGNGHGIFRGTFADANLSAYVTDSKGSSRAVEDMLITFTVISGDVGFSETGNTARYSRISHNNTVAEVTVMNGRAIAPSLKAVGNLGSCTIRVTSPLSGGTPLLLTVNVI